MAYLDLKTGKIVLSKEDKKVLYKPESPVFLSSPNAFLSWITSGGLKDPMEVKGVESKHVDITK